MRQKIGWTAVLALLVAMALGAQGRGATVLSAPNPLFAYSSDAQVYCGPAPLEQWQRDQGIARLFQFQLPLHVRTGIFGVDGFGQPRYLAVTMDHAGGPYWVRYNATVHFRRDGSVEVGRQSRLELRNDSLATPQVAALNRYEAIEALGLARMLTERCRLVR